MNITEIEKKKERLQYMLLGDPVKKFKDICMDFEPRLKVHTLITVQKASNLVKWSMSMWSLIWWCQIIDCLKVETHASSLCNLEVTNTVVVIDQGS